MNPVIRYIAGRLRNRKKEKLLKIPEGITFPISKELQDKLDKAKQNKRLIPLYPTSK